MNSRLEPRVMGVDGLWEVVAPHKESTSVEVLALGGGYRLGVDASLWMVQCEIALTKAPPTEQVNLVLLALVYKVFKLLSQGFLPCVVFDGPRRPSHKRGLKVKGATMRGEPHFREFLDIMGVPWRQAPGEAEAELAQMAMDGMLDAVLSVRPSYSRKRANVAKDDGDTLVFGCPVLIRNSSSGLTGNQGGASGSSSSQADKTTTRTPAVLYRLSDLEAAGLTRPGLILIAMLSGGDYMPQGLPSFGAVSATSLAKQGYGEKLLDGLQRTVGDQVGTGLFLAQWRDEVADELEKNPTGTSMRVADPAHVTQALAAAPRRRLQGSSARQTSPTSRPLRSTPPPSSPTRLLPPTGPSSRTSHAWHPSCRLPSSGRTTRSSTRSATPSGKASSCDNSVSRR